MAGTLVVTYRLLTVVVHELILAAFTRTFPIITKILKTTHYILEGNCFLLQVKPEILKHNQLKMYHTHQQNSHMRIKIQYI